MHEAQPRDATWRRLISHARGGLLRLRGVYGRQIKTSKQILPDSSSSYLVDCYLYAEPDEFDVEELCTLVGQICISMDRDGDVIRGWIFPMVRFRVQVCLSSECKLPVDRTIRHAAAVDDVSAMQVEATCTRWARLSLQQLLDAFHALEAGDSSTAGLHIVLAQGLIVQIAASLAWRSTDGHLSRLPFGAQRSVLADLAMSGEPVFALRTALASLANLADSIAEFGTATQTDDLLRLLGTARRAFQAEEVTAPFYGKRAAQVYDRFRKFPAPVEERLRAIARHFADQHVVELGVGTGRLAALFAPTAAFVTATDASPDMLSAFGQRCSDHGLRNVRACRAHIGSTPLDAGRCDLLIEHEAYVFVPSATRLASEIDRILSRRGLVLRLIATSTPDEATIRAMKTFDHLVAKSTADGIVFIGEDIDALLDAELKRRGLGVAYIGFWDGVETLPGDQLFDAWRARAYPYLSLTSDDVIERALAAARQQKPSGPCTIHFRYRLAFSWRRDAYSDDEIQRKLDVLQEQAAVA